MTEEELKQWYEQLVEKEQEFLAKAAALRDAQRETFSMIYGFPPDVRLCATEEIRNTKIFGGWVDQIRDELEIISFDLQSDTFTITDGEFIIPNVPLNIITKMIC